MDLPLNALWAFAVSARHLNFAHAANELHLSPTAVSQHVKNLEARYGVRLFHRLPRGLALTDEGRAILPAVAASFDRLAESLQQLRDGRPRETLTLGVVATYAVGWLLPRLAAFQMACPHVDLRLHHAQDLMDVPLLRSYRVDEWDRWCTVAGVPVPPLRGRVFDSSLALAEAAALGAGVALLPTVLFQRDLAQAAWSGPGR